MLNFATCIHMGLLVVKKFNILHPMVQMCFVECEFMLLSNMRLDTLVFKYVCVHIQVFIKVLEPVLN